MNEAEERARFEKWSVEHLGDDRYLLRDEQHPESYDAYLMDHLWLCWTAARAASPVSSLPVAFMCPEKCGCLWRDNHDGTMSLFGPSSKSCPKCEFLPLDKLIPLFAEAVAPVSAEQPTKCPTCGSDDPKVRFTGRLGAMDITCSHYWHRLAAPSVASEDSATQPTKIASGRESAESELNQAGAASNQATEHKTAESRNGREADNTPATRGAVITTPSLRNEPLAVSSEDWMRKAAESSAYKLYPPTKYCTSNASRCHAEGTIFEEIAKHYAASKLTEKENHAKRNR